MGIYRNITLKKLFCLWLFPVFTIVMVLVFDIHNVQPNKKMGAKPITLESGKKPPRSSRNFYHRRGKRLMDIIISLTALILLSPLMLTVTILVRLKLGSPVLFRQTRPGLNGKSFTIFKFRTMTNAKDSEGRLLPDDQRLTAFGKFLRSTSLDELPELFNVLKGDMSVVGPRPLRVAYLSRYTQEQARRHDVLPGITGWAQVNGRNAVQWEKRFELDVWYVDHYSWLLDLRIMFQTFLKILKREGISEDGHVTMSEFKGIPTASRLPHSNLLNSELDFV